MPIDDSSDPWLHHTSNCLPLQGHHYAVFFAVNASTRTFDTPLWSDLISPRADAVRENRGICRNCHEDNNSFKNNRHPFITASGCLNSELGNLCDDDEHRR